MRACMWRPTCDRSNSRLSEGKVYSWASTHRRTSAARRTARDAEETVQQHVAGLRTAAVAYYNCVLDQL